jgi:N-formylglutamate deformylase
MLDSRLPGFVQTGDASGRWPVVLASPHSGQDYPAAFLAASRLNRTQLRRAEDPFVDQLLADVADVPVLAARYGRAFLDLNRAAGELDSAMFDAPLPVPVTVTDRVAAGLGVLPRVAAYGCDIYRRRLDPNEAVQRIALLHRPWHDRISTLLARARAQHGYAILLDCHSMPQPAGILPPQIVLGDRFGTSAAPALMAIVEQHFRAAGWRVARNRPYAGGHTTEYHAAVADGVHTVQIEIDRTLYMDPARMVPHAGFAQVASVLTALVPRLLAAAPGLGLSSSPHRDAAE